MNNQKGEVVTGVMVVIMVGMMLFGMIFMHGGHGDRHDHDSTEHKQEHSDKGHQHMHEGHNATEQDPASATEENK
jgi:ABC-type nickel/cobalt efflux system permease component RcnA